MKYDHFSNCDVNAKCWIAESSAGFNIQLIPTNSNTNTHSYAEVKFPKQSIQQNSGIDW